MQEQTCIVIIAKSFIKTLIPVNLSKLGYTGVAMLERSELTSGSTWHNAGGRHPIYGDPNVAKIQQYTTELYKDIEKLTGQPIPVLTSNFKQSTDQCSSKPR